MGTLTRGAVKRPPTTEELRSNLRLATLGQNAQNSGNRRNSTSGFKGVSWTSKAPNRPWYAYIKVNGKRRHLGSFPTAEEAHVAYCAAANVAFGEFACFGRN